MKNRKLRKQEMEVSGSLQRVSCSLNAFFPLGWKEAVMELGKSWSVAPSAGCSPGVCKPGTCRGKEGWKAPERTAKAGGAVLVEAGYRGSSVGASALCRRRGGCSGGAVLCYRSVWVPAVLPGLGSWRGRLDGAWNVALPLGLSPSLEPTPLFSAPVIQWALNAALLSALWKPSEVPNLTRSVSLSKHALRYLRTLDKMHCEDIPVSRRSCTASCLPTLLQWDSGSPRPMQSWAQPPHCSYQCFLQWDRSGKPHWEGSGPTCALSPTLFPTGSPDRVPTLCHSLHSRCPHRSLSGFEVSPAFCSRWHSLVLFRALSFWNFLWENLF